MTVNRPADCIHIEQLEVLASVGVTETERARVQRLAITITLWPQSDFARLDDDVAKTVNYSAVCDVTRTFLAGRSDKLIETIADQLAAHLLGAFKIRAVDLEIRKFIIPDAAFVAVRLTRSGGV
ncbi:MAG: dihydroneopterin aldolase [Chthoniobacterales bacterium]